MKNLKLILLSTTIIPFFLFLIMIIILFRKRCQNRYMDALYKYADLDSSKKILDLGCGSCCLSKKLKSQNVTSLDVIDASSKYCSKPVIFDGKKIPYDRNSFDIGLCSFVLHHTPNQEDLLIELKRTCKTIMILENTPEKESDWKYIKKHAQSDWGKCEECFKTREDWKKCFYKLGFHIIAIERVSGWYCPFSTKPFFYPVPQTTFFLKSHV